MDKKYYACDYFPFTCPYNASYNSHCYNFCGLGADEDTCVIDEDTIADELQAERAAEQDSLGGNWW